MQTEKTNIHITIGYIKNVINILKYKHTKEASNNGRLVCRRVILFKIFTIEIHR